MTFEEVYKILYKKYEIVRFDYSDKTIKAKSYITIDTFDLFDLIEGLKEIYAHKIEISKKFAEILDDHFVFDKSGLQCTKSVVDDDEEKLITQNWDLTYAYLNPLTRKFVEVVE